jgi:MFS family permease
MINKELILATLSGSIVIMGLGLIIPLFPIYVSQKGASNIELGLIVSAFTFSQFLVQPFFGGLSDRWGRKPFMVGGMACYGVVALLYIFAHNLPQIFLIRLLSGAGAGMIWPALAAFVVDQSSVERRGETMSLLSGMEMLGFAIGPFLGGLLYVLGGMNLPFLFCSFLSLLAAGMIWWRIQEKPMGNKSAQKRFVERYGFSSIRIRDIRLLCIISFAESFVWGTIITLLPVMASRMGVSPGKIGWLFSAYFVVYILLQRPVGKWSDLQGRKNPILLGITIYTLAVFLLSQGGTLSYFLIVLAIAGAGLGIYSPSVRVGIADLSSEELRGANMGFFFTTRMFGFFLGPNISGLMADRFGFGFPFLVGTACSALGIWASYSLSPELAQRRIPLPARVICSGNPDRPEMKQ